MIMEIKLEDVLKLVDFELVDGKLQIAEIHGNINGNDWGNVNGSVWGDVLGNIKGSVLGSVAGDIKGDLFGAVCGRSWSD